MSTILVADCHRPDHRRYRELLPGFSVLIQADLAAVEKVIESGQRVDAAVVLWQSGGAEIIRFLSRRIPGLKIIAVDETLNRETFARAQQLGATEFVMKPLDESLTNAVNEAMGESSDQATVAELQVTLVGDSPEWRGALESIVRVLRGENQPVLITGETGTGKELVAKAIHSRGLHANEPFVAINAAAVQPTLLEAILFGHEKGAFTDAKAQRLGIFEECRNGTLFLDEIGELSEPMQRVLLRVLQERTFRRVGGNVDVPFRGRPVFATNRELEDEVRQGRFRQDLLSRISTHHIHLPPLRKRRDDWLLLAAHFLKKHRPEADLILSPAVRAVLADCEFVGNARELESAIQHCLSHDPGRQILPGHLPPDLLAKRQATSDENELIFPQAWLEMPQKTAMKSVEATFNRQYLTRIMQLCHGNVSQAAKMAELDPKTFRSKWKEAGLPALHERE
jgi:two-component system response regulator HydG